MLSIRLILIILTFEKIVSRNVTILYLTDINNAEAKIAYNATIHYINSQKKLNVNVKTKKIGGDNNNYTIFLESLCGNLSELIANGTSPNMVIDITKTGLISEGAKALTHYFGIPTISTSFGLKGDLNNWKYLTSTEENYLIQILPPQDIIIQIVRSIMIEQQYSTAGILTDDSYEIEHIYKFLLQNIISRHIIARIDMKNPIQQLLDIKKQDIFNMFVIGSLDNIKLVLDAADAIRMYTSNFAWHAITHESGKLKCECNSANVIFAQPILQEEYKNRYQVIKNLGNATKSELLYGYYFDVFLKAILAVRDIPDLDFNTNTSCENANKTIFRNGADYDLRKYFNQDNGEMPSYGTFNISTNGYNQINFDMNVQVVIFEEGSSFKILNLGKWKAGFDKTIKYTTHGAIKKYKSNLVYRVSTVVQHPFVYEDPTAPKKFSGYCIDLLNQIAAMLDFDYDIIPVMDSNFGRMDENGNWNGVIREIIARRVDIGLGSFSVTQQRSLFVDYTVPYYEPIGSAILLKVPEVPTSIFRFLIVFEIDAWMGIIIACILTSLLISFLYRFSPYGYRNVKAKKMKTRNFFFQESFFFCLMSLTSQGGGEAPANYSSRIVAGVWWIFSFIIVSSYSANLAAFLTVQRMEAAVNSIEDLANQYKISYSTFNNSDTMQYIERMSIIESKLHDEWIKLNILDKSLSEYEKTKFAVWEYPLSNKFTNLWFNILRYGLESDDNVAVKKVQESPSLEEGFAYITDGIDAAYRVLTNCDLQVVDEFNKRPLALIVQKESALKTKFDTAILELSNKKVLEDLKQKWWTNNPYKAKCNAYEDNGIDINNMGGIFIYLIVSLGFFAIYYLVVYVWRRLKRRSNILNSKIYLK